MVKVILILATIAVAVIAGTIRLSQRRVVHSLAEEFRRLSSDAEHLLSDVRARIQSLRAMKSGLYRTIEGLDHRIQEIVEREMQTQNELRQGKVILTKYAEFVELNNGVILADGKCVAPDEVRRQFDFESRRNDRLQQMLELFAQQRENAERIRRSKHLHDEKVEMQLARLDEAQEQLQEHLSYLQLVVQSSSEKLDAKTLVPDVEQLERKVRRIQDQIGAYLHEAPESRYFEEVELTLIPNSTLDATSPGRSRPPATKQPRISSPY